MCKSLVVLVRVLCVYLYSMLCRINICKYDSPCCGPTDGEISGALRSRRITRIDSAAANREVLAGTTEGCGGRVGLTSLTGRVVPPSRCFGGQTSGEKFGVGLGAGTGTRCGRNEVSVIEIESRCESMALVNGERGEIQDGDRSGVGVGPSLG